ncbi:ATP-binding protein [Mesorhizobium sp. M0243]|uniref:ATP-binding protein n=1 Tax=unclassified Mesorhizobium TaxID=325217 RepID=UPI0033399025
MLAFFAAGENVLLVGKPGTGKSHIAKAIAHQAVLHSHRFSISDRRLLPPPRSGGPAQREARMQTITDSDLLMLDERRRRRMAAAPSTSPQSIESAICRYFATMS